MITCSTTTQKDFEGFTNAYCYVRDNGTVCISASDSNDTIRIVLSKELAIALVKDMQKDLKKALSNA